MVVVACSADGYTLSAFPSPLKPGLIANGVGARVGVRCYVGCWRPNDLTRVGLILTCWNSNACWTENVSVIVRFKDVLFCSMLDTCVFEPLRRCQTIAMQTSLSRRSAG